MCNLNPACPNFLNTDDHQFATFHHTLDNVLRKLRLDGVGVPKQAEVFTKEDEELLWLDGILTVDNPKGLLRARLKTRTLDNLMRVSIEGSSLEEWDPTPALRKWELMGNRRIETSQEN